MLSPDKRYDISRWTVEIDSGTSGYGGVANPVVRDGHVYVGEWRDESYQLTALRSDDATREWSQPLRGRNETPVVADGTVFVPSTNVVKTNRIGAFTSKSGDKRWHFDFGGGRVTAITYRSGRLYFAQRAAVDGKRPARVFALSDDGSELWRTEVDGSVEAPVAVSGEHLFVGSFDGKLHTLNVKTGETEWTFTTDNAIRCAPTLTDESVIVVNEAGEMYRISTDGQRRWQESATSPDSGAGLAVSSESVFVGGEDGLFALRKTDGSEQWSLEADSRVTTPAVANETVYVGIDDTLVAVRIESGDVVWRRTIPSITRGDTIIQGVTSAPAVGDDELYVGTASGFHRFGSPE